MVCVCVCACACTFKSIYPHAYVYTYVVCMRCVFMWTNVRINVYAASFLHGISGSRFEKSNPSNFCMDLVCQKDNMYIYTYHFDCEYFHFPHWPYHLRQVNSCWFSYAPSPQPPLLLLLLHSCWCCYAKKFKPNSNNRNNQLKRIPLHKFLRKGKRKRSKGTGFNWENKGGKSKNAIRWVDTNLNNLKWSLYFTPTKCIIQCSKLLLVFFFHKLFVTLWKERKKRPRNVENERMRENEKMK